MFFAYIDKRVKETFYPLIRTLNSYIQTGLPQAVDVILFRLSLRVPNFFLCVMLFGLRILGYLDQSIYSIGLMSLHCPPTPPFSSLNHPEVG